MDQGERVTVKELAEQLGISKTAIQKRADALGIVFAKEGKRGTRTATKEQAEAIREAIKGTNLGTDPGADQDEQINIFEIIDEPEQSEGEPKEPPKQPKAERRTKAEQKEPDATGAAIEALREQLRVNNERAAQDREQANAEIMFLREQLRTKDELLKANDEKIKGLMIMLREEQARTDALLPAPGPAEPEQGTDQQAEPDAGTNQAPAETRDAKPATLWQRIKAYFGG